MPKPTWEEQISLYPHPKPAARHLEPAAHHRAAEGDHAETWSGKEFYVDLEDALARDTCAIPPTPIRAGYYGNFHYSYWASGLWDFSKMMRAAESHGVQPERYLDLGCSSGRVLRHMAHLRPEVQSFGCDIDRRPVEWALRHLPSHLTVFQNHSIPTLPLAEESLDLVSSFSVFTHIECFDTAWLMELRRILRPGGLAYLTIHSDRTWRELEDTITLFDTLKTHPDFASLDRSAPLPTDPYVIRFDTDSSYSSHVFTSEQRVRDVWSRYLEVLHILPKHSFDQDVVVLRKREA